MKKKKTIDHTSMAFTTDYGTTILTRSDVTTLAPGDEENEFCASIDKLNQEPDPNPAGPGA